MVPTLTTDERRANLDKAMQVRSERKTLRDSLKAGTCSIGRVLELADNGCAAAANMRVKQLISAMPGYGFALTQQAMHDLRIAECKRVKGLGQHQRAALVSLFGGDAA